MRHRASLFSSSLSLLVQLALLGALVAATSPPLRAQNLLPRAHWPAPKGTKVFSSGAVYNDGNVLVDTSLPLLGTDARSFVLSLGYLHFIDLAGRTASFTVQVPWTDAHNVAEGTMVSRRREMNGFGDMHGRLSVNLKGAPTMGPEGFREFVRENKWLVGTSLEIAAPTGDYDPNLLANLGSNRWQLRPELGFIRKLAPGWGLEGSLGMWIFEDNENFFGGQTLEQDALTGLELHLVRFVRRTNPEFWWSLDLNFYHGGRTTIDGVEKPDLQQNSRVGVTTVVPVYRGHFVKFAVATGLETEAGGDYHSFTATYQRAWR
jgi:hypothetical protein